MAVTVGQMKKMLSDFSEDLLVYCFSDDGGMVFPKLSAAGPIEGLPEEEMKDAKLDKFVVIIPED